MFLTYCWVSICSAFIKDDIHRRWHHLVFLSGAQRAKSHFQMHTDSQNIRIICLCIHGKMFPINLNTLHFETSTKCNVKPLAQSLCPVFRLIQCELWNWVENKRSQWGLCALHGNRISHSVTGSAFKPLLQMALAHIQSKLKPVFKFWLKEKVIVFLTFC